MTSFLRQKPAAGSYERDKELLGLTRDRKVNDQGNSFSKPLIHEVIYDAAVCL
jgi:hypothetical protein